MKKAQPTNCLVTPLLTDLYQLTMVYAYWQSGRHEDKAVFDLFFRKNPFGGEYTIFCGLEEVLRFVSHFSFNDSQIEYLKTLIPQAEDAFFKWLRSLDCRDVRIYSIKEGTLVFPRLPLLRVEGPLGIAQLLETTLLNLVNFPSLIATNAARFRKAAGPQKMLLEFGLRRAQGSDGALSASRYSYVGGFDGTSNVLSGYLFNIPVKGTHAHSFVQSFASLSDLNQRTLVNSIGQSIDFVSSVLSTRRALGFEGSNEGELAAFIAYAQSFPNGFLALVDTYDTLQSGVANFLSVAVELVRAGYTPVGIRLDSGDLAFLSKAARKMMQDTSEKMGIDVNGLIVASNDINESVLLSLAQQGHEIDAFGIGTHLVTCQAQPALGGVYKLVEVNGTARIKLSQDINKVTIPGRKVCYRLSGSQGYPLIDVMLMDSEDAPKVGERCYCRHPFDERKRVYVTPSKVKALHSLVWDGKAHHAFPSLSENRDYVISQLEEFRQDHLRSLNPTPYKVSVSDKLYRFMHELWAQESPVRELE